ncbi:Hypothetical_protein [Hexamita inflata]|uniref:Hypothetical_protein n=1 Tax=Hexamita inflata TaxID=28002 RepID=A0ABP1JYP0_9EUKA
MSHNCKVSICNDELKSSNSLFFKESGSARTLYASCIGQEDFNKRDKMSTKLCSFSLRIIYVVVKCTIYYHHFTLLVSNYVFQLQYYQQITHMIQSKDNQSIVKQQNTLFLELELDDFK